MLGLLLLLLSRRLLLVVRRRLASVDCNARLNRGLKTNKCAAVVWVGAMVLVLLACCAQRRLFVIADNGQASAARHRSVQAARWRGERPAPVQSVCAAHFREMRLVRTCTKSTRLVLASRLLLAWTGGFEQISLVRRRNDGRR